jgi:hypothetical protein
MPDFRQNGLVQTFSCSFGKYRRSCLNHLDRVKQKIKTHAAATIAAASHSFSTKQIIPETGKSIRSGQAMIQMPPKMIAKGVNKTARHINDHKPLKAARETVFCLAMDWFICPL